jgi:hypothetical protein
MQTEFDSSQRFWLAILCMLSVTICVITIVVTVGFCAERKSAFENGYEQRVLPGSQSDHWIKSETTSTNSNL